jgi:hypothetical protein
MRTTTIYSLVVSGLLGLSGLAQAEHNKDCKNVHGKVTVITANGITVNDKLYKVGESTRITKDDKVVKLEKLAAGDIVCLDTRGNDQLGGEAAAVTVLSAKDPAAVREKDYVREKTVIKDEPAPAQSREVIREKEKIREEK